MSHLEDLKKERDALIQRAVEAAHAYFRECELGEERIKASEIHENLRNAGRVY